MKERSTLQEDALFRPPTKIGPYELRPLSAASLVLLRRTNNPFGTGAAVDTESGEGMFAALAFIYMHAAPLPEVFAASRDPERLDSEVLEFSAGFPLTILQTAIEAITGQFAEASASISEAEAPEGSDESPNGQRRPGSRTASSQSRPKRVGRGTK